VQFVRLTTTLLKVEESARDNHVLACYLSFIAFSGINASQGSVRVWQHTQCVVGPIIITYCKFTK